jgi:hypothetical protein
VYNKTMSGMFPAARGLVPLPKDVEVIRSKVEVQDGICGYSERLRARGSARNRQSPPLLGATATEPSRYQMAVAGASCPPQADPHYIPTWRVDGRTFKRLHAWWLSGRPRYMCAGCTLVAIARQDRTFDWNNPLDWFDTRYAFMGENETGRWNLIVSIDGDEVTDRGMYRIAD